MKCRKKSGLKSSFILGFTLGLVLWLAVHMGFAAFAAEKPLVDTTKTGSLRFTMVDSDSAVVKGGNLQVFKIAEITQVNNDQKLSYLAAYDSLSNKPALTDSNLSATLKDSTGLTNNNKFAKTLADFVKSKGIAASKSVTVDTTGKAEITDLSLGLYLVTQPTAATGYKPMAPFLVTVPQWNDTTASWVYDITSISPKMQSLTKDTTKPAEDPTKDPTKDPTTDPTKDPTKTPTTTTTTTTTTTKTPTTTPTTTTTTKTPTTTTGTTSTKTTTSGTTATKTSTTAGTTATKLPQTGQVNWPIPVLAGLGLVLLVTGIVLDRRNAR